MSKVGVGIVGCGNISPIYLQNLSKFEQTEVVAVADLDQSKAQFRASGYGISKVCTVEELLSDPDVSVVLNLTVPKAHFEVAQKAIRRGKHVYNEKPLSVDWEQGKELVKLADEASLLVGCAPDTFMGAGIQTCLEVIESGVIGVPVAAQAFMMCRGHESWHPDPGFYYEKGGGPMFDMGPYYLTTLVALLGPVRRVSGSARVSFPTRTVTSEPKNGTIINVETPTHLSSVLDFASGVVCQVTMSFDVPAHSMPHIEIYGSEGTLQVPDPNGFGGVPKLYTRTSGQWEDVSLSRPYEENSRGVGVLDLVQSSRQGRTPRASGHLALHVLEVMHAAHWSSETGNHVLLSTTVDRPTAMPTTPL